MSASAPQEGHYQIFSGCEHATSSAGLILNNLAAEGSLSMRSFSWYAHQKRTSGVVGRGTYPALFDCLDDNLRDIFDLHLLFGLYTFNAVIKHGNAERTGSSEDF